MVFFLNPQPDLLGAGAAFMAWGTEGNTQGVSTPAGPSFAVEFDVYPNPQTFIVDDLSSDSELGLDFNYSMVSTAQADISWDVALADGTVKYAWIDYSPQAGAVWVSYSSVKPTSGAQLDADVPNDHFCLYPGSVYAGFAAATATWHTGVTISTWQFATGPNAAGRSPPPTRTRLPISHPGRAICAIMSLHAAMASTLAAVHPRLHAM
eukprot:jgi/Mesen1/31/ME1082489C05696